MNNPAEFSPSAAEVVSFARQSIDTADRRILLSLGRVQNTALILKKTGLNVTGFTRILDNYGVRHTIKQHGDPIKETRRGQIAVTLEDFGKIGLITTEPDDIFSDGTNKIGRQIIVFVKLMGGIGYWHVEELRGKHKLVATDSMRKKNGAWSA